MAYVELHKEKLNHNFHFLDKLFEKNDIEWGVVSKLLCGNEEYLKILLQLGIRVIMDSRMSNLEVIKGIDPSVETVYIKPPARQVLPELVKYADYSFNTELSTIKAISREAKKQNKIHKIIIMIEMGDLREGVLGEGLVEFYGQVFNLPNIEVAGIGTNLNCLSGVMPSHDKLVQLSLYEQLIEAKFNKKIKWVSGGTSVAIPLVLKKLIPKGNNHFRVGETLFLGNNLVTGEPLEGMKSDVFKLYAEIIELIEKPKVPMGEIGTNVAGESPEIIEEDYGKTSYRALLDLGLLDIDLDNIIPDDSDLEFAGASSDMIVLDLGKSKKGYKVGDIVSFTMNYMGVLGVMNSDYIDKRTV